MLKHLRPTVNPRLGKHAQSAFRQEYQAITSLLRLHWAWAILIVGCIFAIIYAARPIPPSSVKMAAGQPNSSLHVLAQKYADYFKTHGVNLQLVNTAGAFENIELVKNQKVEAGFSIAGGIKDSEIPNVISLGSIDYQPFWIFYKGDEFNGSNIDDLLNGKVFSINIPGSGTRYMAEKILSVHGVKVNSDPRLLSLPSQESVDALRAGRIDGVFLLAGAESSTLKKLIDLPGIRIASFSFVEAYTKRLKNLEVLNLPRGALDIKRDVPNHDIQMVATTTTILADKNLHPAIQYLFIAAAKQIASDGDSLFDRSGGFPAHIDKSIPLSDVAHQFYEKGAPALAGHVPFWMANFVDRMWIIYLSILLFIYPALLLLPKYRNTYARLCVIDCYEELEVIEHKLRNTTRLDDWSDLVTEFESLEKKSTSLWVPSSEYGGYFNLRLSIEQSRQKLARRKFEIDAYVSKNRNPAVGLLHAVGAK